MKIKSLITLLGTLFIALVMTRCAALLIGGATGAGTYAYIKGEMKVTKTATLDRTWSAS